MVISDSTGRAVLLLSGGIDSYTTLGMALRDKLEVYALTFDYGQRHHSELEAADRIVATMGVSKHLVLRLDLDKIGGSALTGDLEVPGVTESHMIGSEIPITYVPARNSIFLAHALAWAEVVEARQIFIGVNAVDFSGYPDCRPEYLEAFEKMASLATKAGVEGRPIVIKAPLINMSKAEIIRRGVQLGLDYSITHSCYDPDKTGRACGLCESCRLRRTGFEEAKVDDPTEYYVRSDSNG